MSPLPSSSASPPSFSHAPRSPASSKLPKFLQKTNRDRSRSLVDPAYEASSSTIHSSPPQLETVVRKSRRSSGHKEKEEKERWDTQDEGAAEGDGGGEEETPVIVEPVNIPRPRTRSERPISDNTAFYTSSSASKLTELPTRLSGWFSHTFSTSTTDLSLPNLLSQQHLAAAATSPKGKSSALLTAARTGKGHLDKAMRYLLDSDATPDKCADSIWLLGVQHPGYEPPPPTPPPSAYEAQQQRNSKLGMSLGRRSSVESRKSTSLASSTSSSPVVGPGYTGDTSLTQSQPSPAKGKDPALNWPPVFYADWTTRIWLTYRSQFQPIRDTSLSALESEVGELAAPAGSPQPKKWGWLGGERGWTSDAGWGCMLRTGQSLLANTLLHLHLGRDWRKPPYPIYTADYATYVQILTWFLDNPSPLCPFSVHRMALVGKELGKDVGQWFGPSTAAGAIKTLVHAFPEALLGVSVAADGAIYESDVFKASHSIRGSPRRHSKAWGDRAVLVLIGIRLGLDGVNPIYYDTIKTLYTFPQSVGIAGGRPSSSYYFVGSQADNLFYLDPHHARPAVPLRIPPGPSHSPSPARQASPEVSDRERERVRSPHHIRAPTSPSGRSSTGSVSSAFSQRSPPVPSPLQQQLSTSSNSTQSSSGQSHNRWQSYSALPDDSDMEARDFEFGAHLDPMQRHYVTAYSGTELKTFHCDRVRKMPLSGLDPSMLLGFMCKDEQDWQDFRQRVNELNRTHKTIFTIQDEPPSWPSDGDSNMGLESVSEPDIDMPEDDDELISNRSAASRSRSGSPDTSFSVHPSAKSEGDTEDDPVDPITPGVGKGSFDIPRAHGDAARTTTKPAPQAATMSRESSLSFDDEDDEEWMDPLETPPMSPDAEPGDAPQLPTPHAPPLDAAPSQSSTISAETTASGKKRRKSKSKKVRTGSGSPPPPVPHEQFPFPASESPDEPEPEPIPDEARSKRMPQMRTAKARDGGRTQSGGVRGVVAEDLDDF